MFHIKNVILSFLLNKELYFKIYEYIIKYINNIYSTKKQQSCFKYW